MFALTRFLTDPVTIIFVFLLFGVIFIFYKHMPLLTYKYVYFCIFMLYFVFSIPLFGNMLIRYLEMYATDATSQCNYEKKLPQIAVLLAGGFDNDPKHSYDYGALTASSFRRAILAARWLGEDCQRTIIVSGGHGIIPEATIISNLLVDLGTDSSRIVVDSNAMNTAESARNFFIMFNNLSMKICVITSAYHMKRAINEFDFYKIQVCALPTDYRHADANFPYCFIPQISALQKTYVSFHEYGGIFFSCIRSFCKN